MTQEAATSNVPKAYQNPPPTETTETPHFPYIPPSFADVGIQSIHQFPLVLDDNKNPQGRRPALVAWTQFPRVEFQPTNSYTAIILDIDQPRADGFPYGKPSILPSWIVQALDTGRMHVVYALETPVHRNPHSLKGPLKKTSPRRRPTGIPSRSRPRIWRDHHEKPPTTPKRSAYLLDELPALHPRRTQQRATEISNPPRKTPYRHRSQRRHVPKHGQPSSPPTLAPQHRRPRLGRPLARPRAPAQHQLMAPQRATRYGMPVYRQIMRQVFATPIRSRNVQCTITTQDRQAMAQ